MDVNTWEATESKMMVGLEMEMAGVTGKLKETVGSEAETVVGQKVEWILKREWIQSRQWIGAERGQGLK